MKRTLRGRSSPDAARENAALTRAHSVKRKQRGTPIQ
jgi:hypothetical protein